MAWKPDEDTGGMVEDIAFLKWTVADLGARLNKIDEAPPASISTDELTAIIDGVNAVHGAVFGVPFGALQSLKDHPAV